MSLINRSGASALIPEDVSREIVQGTVTRSACLSALTRLPNMTRAQHRMPVLSLLPNAYFVSGEATQDGDGSTAMGGYKAMTTAQWANKYIDAEEIAVIVPIPEAVLDDADYDIWSQVKPRIEEAMGALIDGAILFGTSKPSSWPVGILRGAYYSSNVVLDNANSGDLVQNIGGQTGLMAKVEDSGFEVTAFMAAVSQKARLRGLVDAQDRPIFLDNIRQGGGSELFGAPLSFPRNGAWDASQAGVGQTPGLVGGALFIGGDFKQAVFSIRQDITYKVLTEATLHTDNTLTTVAYNLAQQDMVALRVNMRLGWQVPNPINRLKPTEVDWSSPSQTDARYPFAALCLQAAT